MTLLFFEIKIKKYEVLETKDETADEILFKVHLKLSEMEALYEMSGKNIDEES